MCAPVPADLPLPRGKVAFAEQMTDEGGYWAWLCAPATPSVTFGDSSPVKGELYFVGRGLPDAPMHPVILSGAKNPSPVLLYRGRNTDSSPAAQNDEGRAAQNDGGGANLCVRPPPQIFPQGKASGTVPIHGLFAARGQGRARG